MRDFLKLVVAIALAALSFPAAAQQATGFDRIAFVKAVKEKDGGKVRELMDKHGAVILNAKDTRGDTALTVTMARRDDWAIYFLAQGADPNLAGAEGDTPLITAARVGYLFGAEQLLARKAKVNATNRRGETALIVAVQGRHLPMVELLLDHGADPEKADSFAGLSARDYAKRDTRTPELLRLFEAAKEKPAAQPKKPASNDPNDFTL